MMDYCINPVKMNGRVVAISDLCVTVNIRGRLGVITVPACPVASEKPLRVDDELEFYFSYIQVVEMPLDYDLSDLTAPSDASAADANTDRELFPSLLGGTITEVNDTAVRVAITNNLGTVYVPRRWVFTPKALQQNQYVEFYLSRMQAISKHTVSKVEEENYATND